MMSPFRHNKKVRRHPSTKQMVVSALVCLSIFVAALLFWYKTNLQPVDSTNDETVIVTVEVGMNEAQIAAILESREIIRSAFAYELYARLHGKVGEMIAGGYKLTKSQSVEEIVETFTSGNIAVDLFTILPTQRLDQIKETFREAGYSEEEITSAFNASQYASPALAGKPPLADLEGYLYPESFQFTTSTPISSIIEASLEQMSIALSPSIIAGFEEQGITPHEGVILASIVEREVSSTEDRQKAAQVFLRRYREGISLGSDPTALYGALQFGLEPSVSADTPYNTRLYVGLPPGPINNVSVDSLRSVAYPANTNFLFFVSGDDGKTYFSNTLQEHESLTAQHCIELCKSY